MVAHESTGQGERPPDFFKKIDCPKPGRDARFWLKFRRSLREMGRT